jgi:arsenate-mycothiol transferase
MKILFVCKSNGGRSQMGEAFFNLGSNAHATTSAGTQVGEKEGQPIYSNILEIMQEIGIDLSKKTRKQLTEELVDQADKVIVMDETKNIPDYLLNSPKLIRWDIPNGADASPEFLRQIRDQIKSLVEEFTKNLT